LVIEADKQFYLVSLPATKNVDFAQLKKAIKKMGGSVKTIGIPNEKVLAKKLGIKPGNVTAFAKLHKLPHIVDKDIKKIKKAVLSGGSVSESIKMKMADWLKVEEPRVEIVGVKRKVKKIKKQKAKIQSKIKKSKRPTKKVKKVAKKKTAKRRA
jgi:prolyl-tRNA editing enzyme YbaK/EbsC (Cys-tRNA(Pro) deacylase)